MLRGGSTPSEVSRMVNISSRTLRKYEWNLKLYGNCCAPKALHQGRPKCLTPAAVDTILEYLEDLPDTHADELCWLLYDKFEIYVSERTIYRCLKQRKWSHKLVRLPLI